MATSPEPDPAALRIVDASLNRAAEGLRVVEDYARLALGDAHLARLAKNLRHELAQAAAAPALQRLAARDTEHDVGVTISADDEPTRGDARHVCTASLQRVEQALRTIEEYGKLIDAPLAAAAQGLRYRTYTLEKALGAAQRAAARLGETRLCVLIHGGRSTESFAHLVTELLAAGVQMVQLRDKSLGDRALLERARRLVELTRAAGALAIVNDRVDIAAAAHADGAHLGQDDLPVGEARRILGLEALIGVSTHAIEQAQRAVLDGADYLGVGPTFPSGTKHFDEFPGLDYLRQVAEEISLPTFAIGGIAPDNVGDVLGTGIARVAVSGCVTSACEPARVVERLLAQLGVTASPQEPG